MGGEHHGGRSLGHQGLGGDDTGYRPSRGWLDYEEKVWAYWPEFAENGKERITVRQLLAHQACLFAFDEPADRSTVADLDRLAVVLARQKPAWEPGTRQAYHALILDQLRPKIAIEIGTQFGGGLQALSKYSDQVYSIDIDPEVPKLIGDVFANVRYLTGNSDHLLAPLIDDLQRNGAELAFALVDGDHSANGVREDITCCGFGPRFRSTS